MRVAVIGTGYVGLVHGVVLADLGNEVICVDNDEKKVEMLKMGVSPIYEPGIEEFLERNLREGRLTVTTSISDATRNSEIVFIAVGTPPGPDGTPDLTAVRAVASEIGKSIDHPIVVVNKSTVPVGSGELVSDLIKAAGADASLYSVVSNPEFLREGSAIFDTLNPDRIIIGAKSQSDASKLVELYSTIDKPILITDLESAELIKYSSNSYLAMKISFINAVSRLCEACGGNVADVAKGMGLDQRIGSQFLGAGLGWGGSCFPKDTAGMISVAEKLGYDFQLLKSVVEINDTQTTHFVDRIRDRIGGFSGKTVGLLGLAFKPNTDDIRDAKSLIIAEIILNEGGIVRAFDPVAMENVKEIEPRMEYCDRAYEVAEGADALILVTEWNEFKQLDLKRLGASMKSKILFDGRRVYQKDYVEKHGFEYFTIGSR